MAPDDYFITLICLFWARLPHPPPSLPGSVVFVCIKLKLSGYVPAVLLRALAVFSQHLLHALAGLPLPTKRFNGRSAELTSLGEMMAI